MYLAKNAGFHSYLYISVTEFNSLWLKRSNRTQEVFYWKHFLGTVYLVDLSNTLTYVIIFEVSVKVVLHRFSAGWSADWGDPSVAFSQRMCNPIMSEQRNLSREITVWPGLLNGLWPFPSSHKCAIATLAQRKKLQAVRVVRGSYKLLQGVRNTEVFLFFPCCLFFLIMNIHLLFLYFGCTMWPVVYLVPQPVIKSTPPALKHGALTVGPPGKFLFQFLKKREKPQTGRNNLPHVFRIYKENLRSNRKERTQGKEGQKPCTGIWEEESEIVNTHLKRCSTSYQGKQNKKQIGKDKTN